MSRDQIGPLSDFSSIGPSQSISQNSYPFPEPITHVPNTGPETFIQPTSNIGVGLSMPRRHSAASTAHSSIYHTPGTPATYKVETVTYAPAVSLVVPPSLPSSPMETNAPLASIPTSSSFGIGLPPPIDYASETEMHTTMYIPAAHAISEYEMPTAKVAENGSGSGSATLTGWRHSRGESRHSQEELSYSGSRPQRVSSFLGASAPAPEPTSGPITNLSHTSSTINRGDGVGGSEKRAVPTVVGSALIEVFDERENNDEEEDDSELPVEAEDELIEQGKLAVVENPRFMSEERRKELEKERERWMKQPSSGAEKGKQKSEEPEPEPEGKKNFSFLQHKRTGTQDTTSRVTFAPAVAPSTPKSSPSKAKDTLPYTSPSKGSPSKRFFGSLKGIFGGSRPSPEAAVPSRLQDSSPPVSPPSRFPPPTPTPIVDFKAYQGGDDSDSDELPPTKPRSGFQTFLWGTGGGTTKKKDGGSSSSATGGGRWSTRTDRNIRKLAKGVGGDDDDDDEYGTYLSRDVRNNGVAGDIVVKAGLVDGVVPAAAREMKNKRTAAPGGGPAVSGGGRKLKKIVHSPSVAAAPSASTLHATSATQQRNETTTTTATAITRDLARTPTEPSTILRYSSVKTGDAQTKRRSASVDETLRRPKNVGVGQTTSAGGVVDLGNRRRVSSSVIPATNSSPPVGASSARRMPSTTRTPTAAAVKSAAVSKGYSSDTAAAPRVARAPPTVTPAPATAAAAPPKPTTLSRQSSVGKTQTHHPTSTNPPVENTGGSRHQPQPQPHRQYSASSSGGGAIVLTAGATQPTGTLISRPGWDAQALPTAGGGLSRNNSVLSGVSGAAGGSSSGGAGVKRQRQTSLGHGMGSGTSLGRRSSLGSSSGHGGGGGGRHPVVQAAPPAQSLMSIIEDVAKHNREWNEESSQLLKNRNRIVSGGGSLLEKEKKMGPVVGMVDVVKAPRSFGREELARLDPAMIKARVMETSTTTTNMHPAPAAATGASGASGSRGRMIDIKAPGSIFDQRDTTATAGSAPAAVRPKVYRQASNSAPDLTQRQQQQVDLAQRPSGTTAGPAATFTPASRSKRPAKSPLRSAMKNPSRTPSPLTSPFLVQKQQQAIQEGSRLGVKSNLGGVVAPVPAPPAQYSSILGSQQSSHTPSTTAATDIQSTTMTNGRTTSVSVSQRRNGKRQVKGAPDGVVGEDAGDSSTGDDIFFTDDEGDNDQHAGAVVVSSSVNQTAPPMLNGHAVGYTGSDGSHSTTSTAVHRLPPPTTTSSTTSQQPGTTLLPRRRKSVRVSLKPTFSPSPPAVEYDDDDKDVQPWAWKQEDHYDHHRTTEGSGGWQRQQLHVHAPVPVAAGHSLLLNPVRQQKVVAAPPEPSAHDIWEDSDEDVEYQNAKLLLTRAAKKERDMKAFAARSRS